MLLNIILSLYFKIVAAQCVFFLLPFELADLRADIRQRLITDSCHDKYLIKRKKRFS